MGGLSMDKVVIIGVIAVFLLGPERLPGYAQKLGALVRNLRQMANGAKDRMREEMGPEFDDVDWRKLDPRQYDPRRIIREALLEDPEPDPDFVPMKREKAVSPGAPKALTASSTPPPFDSEAT